MVLGFMKKRPDARVVSALYQALVTQARQPVLYAQWGVPDTVSGRFDMISLHAALLFRRLRADGETGLALSQAIFDLFFKDIDRSLREMGVGDLAVPKKIQKMGSVFYGLLAAINEAMDKKDEAALSEILRRNLFDGAEVSGLGQICAYVWRQDAGIAALAYADIADGKLALENA